MQYNLSFKTKWNELISKGINISRSRIWCVKSVSLTYGVGNSLLLDTFHLIPTWSNITLKQKSVNKHVVLNETLRKILTASSTWRLYNFILAWSFSIMSWSLSWILRSSSHWKANSFILRSDLRAFFCVSAWWRCSLSNSVSSSRTY